MTRKIEPWKTLKSEMVFDHPWYKVRRDHVELPDGQQLDDYFVSVRANVVVVFAVTEDEQVIFVRQYKHAFGEILIELPGGVVDEGEKAPQDAAQRELLEETGYTSDPLELLLEVSDNPTKDTNTIYFYLGRNARKIAAQELDSTENIEVLTAPLAQVENMILTGQIKVTGSVALCLLALRKLQR